MKAQSELAGDRERRAETTRPHLEMEQQIWMSSIKSTYNTISAMEARFKNDLACVDAMIASTSHDLTDSDNSEVNHRPASQQWLVCTP